MREKFEQEYASDTYQMSGATKLGNVSFEYGEKKGWYSREDILVIAVMVKRISIAPSQLNGIKDAFGHVIFQLLTSRTSHEDILTVQLEPKDPGVDAAEKFSRLFRDRCVLAIDRLEFPNPSTVKQDDGLVMDQRLRK